MVWETNALQQRIEGPSPGSVDDWSSRTEIFESITSWWTAAATLRGRDGSTPVTGVQVTDDSIVAELADGRTISVPLAWSWRLSDATPEQRSNWRLIGSGQGIRWPDVDEDISVRGMLDGVPAVRGRPRAA